MDSRRTQVAVLLVVFVVMVLGLHVEQIEGLTMPLSDNARQKDGTVRVDPLDKLNKYRGGFDITNKHYWSSTIFTGVHGYAMGVLWLVCGVLYGCFLVATTCCHKRISKRKAKKKSLGDYSQSYILLATFFTILAIVASGLVLGGNARFHSEAKSVMDIIMEATNETSETIFNTTEAMRGMRDSLEANNGGAEASLFLTSMSEKLGTEAAEIEVHISKNTRLINKGLEIVYIITTVTVSFNLLAVIALTTTGILRLPRAFNSLIVLCWFLTILFWFFFGLYFFLERFSTDSCTALENFEENPNNNSLSSVLPCNELLSAKPLLFQVRSGIYDLVNEVNKNISLQATFYTNLVTVCNPFSAPPEYQYQPENCSATSIRIGDIPKALKLLTCGDTNNETCRGGLISATELQTVEAYSSSIQELVDAYPGMENLVECQSVKDAFAEILVRNCKPLKRYARLVWSGMVFLSATMVILILLWMAKTHHEHHYRFSDGSVMPHTDLESRMDGETEQDSKPSSVL